MKFKRNPKTHLSHLNINETSYMNEQIWNEIIFTTLQIC